MAKTALLNNVEHKHLRVDTRRRAGLGDDVMFALIFPAEFRNIQAHYPIVFRKTAEGGFQPIALFGFKDGQNLFLDETRWDAAYLPLSIERQPFLIGVDGDEMMVHVDLDSPRVGTDFGETVFLEHGGTSEFLEHKNSVLLALFEGLQSTPAFVAALLEHDLLESFTLDIELDDGTHSRLAGFYAVNEERLAGLDAAALARLHQDGYLQPIYMAIASVSNFRALIDRMNQINAATA
jgi:SapC